MRFFLFCLLVLASSPAWSAPARVEGTLSQTRDGQTTRAKIYFEAPSRMRLEIERDEAAGIDAQIVVADGDDARLWIPATKRLRRLGFNIAQKWWRGWSLTSGGPANFVLAGAAPATITESEGAFSRRDEVLFGGGGGDAFYAASKSVARRFPRAIAVSPTTRIEASDSGRELSLTTITVQGELPTKAIVEADGARTQFDYELKERAEPFDETLWQLPTDGALAEDQWLEAPAIYAKTDSPDARFNLALAKYTGAEDVAGAISLLETVSREAPRASAPAIALFEIALGARDLARAETALNALKDKVSPGEWQARRARLLQARRDFEGAQAALDAALEAEPRQPLLRWARANLGQTRGDIAGARKMWRELFVDESAPINLRVGAVEAFATSAAIDETRVLRDEIKGETEAEILARALLSLRAGEVQAPILSSPSTRVSWALGLEKANRDDAARAIWESLSASSTNPPDTATQRLALAHLVTLEARRGDVAASLAQFRLWSDGLESEPEIQSAQLVLFEAWQKAFKREALAVALENRASATAAKAGDARLFYAYQVAYGEPEDVQRALDLSALRFPKDAFWASKRAETLTARALGQSTAVESSAAARDSTFAKAFEAINLAIELEPSQPLWRLQKSLIASQRSAKLGSSDANRAVRERRAATIEVEALLKALPGDADALVSAAVQTRAFDGDAGIERALEWANAALDTAPGDGDRHTLVFAARQTIAHATEKTRPAVAAAQWETLLLAAQNAGEEANLAGAYFGFLERRKDAPRAARLLSQLAGESWEFEGARALLDAIVNRALGSPLLPEIGAQLREDASAPAQIAFATLAAARLERALQILLDPAAPASADAEKERATRDMASSMPLLTQIAQGNNRLFAARASAFLATRAALAPEDAVGWLRRARALESGDASLRLALIGALEASDATREEAARERIALEREFPFDPEIARLLALDTWEAGDNAGANARAEEAFNVAAHNPFVRANDLQKQAFTRARIAWTSGDFGRATELYGGLALQQWAPIDRAAALLAWRARLQESGRDAEVAPLNARIKALELNLRELQTATAFVEATEN